MLKKIMVPLLSCVVFSGFVGCGGDGASVGSICSNWCKLVERCYPGEFYDYYMSVNECREACIDEFDFLKKDPDITDACYNAEKKLANCVSKLSCSELDDYFDEPYANYPCAQYDRDAERECGWDSWD